MSGVHAERKARANQWANGSGLLQAVEVAVNAACRDEPEDTHGFMCAHFERLADDPVITRLLQRPGLALTGDTNVVSVMLECRVHCSERMLATMPHTLPEGEGKETLMPSTRQPSAREDLPEKGVPDTPSRDRGDGRSNQVDGTSTERSRVQSGVIEGANENGVKRKTKVEAVGSGDGDNGDDSGWRSPVVSAVEQAVTGVSLRDLQRLEQIIDGTAEGTKLDFSLLFLRSLALFERTSLFTQAAKLRAETETPTRLPTPMALVFAPAQSPGKLRIPGVYVRCPRLYSPTKTTMALAAVEKGIRDNVARSKAGALTANFTDAGHLAPSIDKLEQVLGHVRVACRSGDLTLGRDVFLVLDIGAGGLHDAAKGKYEITQGHHKLAQDWCEELLGLIQNEENGIAAVIDPFSPQDEVWQEFKAKIGNERLDIFSTADQTPEPLSGPSAQEITARCLQASAANTIATTMATLNAWAMGGVNTALMAQHDAVLGGDNDDVVDLAAAARAEFFTCALPHKHPRTYDRLIALQQELQWEGLWAPASRIRRAVDATRRRSSAKQNKEAAPPPAQNRAASQPIAEDGAEA